MNTLGHTEEYEGSKKLYLQMGLPLTLQYLETPMAHNCTLVVSDLGRLSSYNAPYLHQYSL